MTDQFKGLLHLSLNNLLVSNEILASTKPEDSPDLEQALDFIQRENQEMLNHLDTEEKRDKYKSDYAILSNEIAAAVNHPFETQFSGGKVTSEDSKESIASLLTLEEVISPLSVHTFNTLLHRFLGVLELSGINSLDQYPEDKLTFPFNIGLIC